MQIIHLNIEAATLLFAVANSGQNSGNLVYSLISFNCFFVTELISYYLSLNKNYPALAIAFLAVNHSVSSFKRTITQPIISLTIWGGLWRAFNSVISPLDNYEIAC